MTTTVLAYLPSPSQGVWHLWIFPIRAYALCIIAGIIAAMVIGDRRWAARGGERGVIYDVALWAVPFGLVGGRLYHVMTDWPKYFGPDGAGFLAALKIWDGGLGIWGAVALGGVGAWIACRQMHIPLPAFGDAIAPGIILAQAIGRFGNYFNQELYGRATDLPWGLEIYNRLDPSGVVSPHSLDGVSTGQVFAVVHPTFLYELLWNLLVFAMLLWADRRFNLGHGRLFALYVAGYCVGRFWVELMRSDDATLIAGIRVNTFTSTFVFIGAVIYIMAATKGRDDPATLGGKQSAELPSEDESTPTEDWIDDLKASEATSGIVAAATVAGADDAAETVADKPEDVKAETAAEADGLAEQPEKTPSSDTSEARELDAAGAAADEPEASLGAVEGDDAVAAQAAAADVHEAAVEAADEAQSVAEAVATDEPAVADADAAVEESTAGLGSVEGVEVVAAEGAAAEVHEAAVDGADEAEVVADAVAAEEPESESVEPEAPDSESAEPEPDSESAEPETPESESVEPAVADSDAAVEESTAGLGSVEGAEVVAAEGAAAEVHEAAVDGADEAESVADDVAAEEPDSVSAEPETPESESVEPAVADSEAAVEESTAGLGSVEGAEVVAAEGAAAEVHEAAVDGADEAAAVADDVAAEEPVSAAVPEEEPRRRWRLRRS